MYRSPQWKPSRADRQVASQHGALHRGQRLQDPRHAQGRHQDLQEEEQQPVMTSQGKKNKHIILIHSFLRNLII